MFVNKFHTVLAIAAGAIGALAAVPPLSAQTLADALHNLILEHPQIKAQTKTLASSREEIKKASAAFLPTVNLAGDIGREVVSSTTTRNTENEGAPSPLTRQTTSFTVTQNVFNGFAQTSGSKAARFDKLVQEATLSTLIQTTMMEGVSAYIDVLRQLQLVELSAQNEETIQIQLNLEDERVAKGSGIAVDVLQAKSRLQLAKERRVRFEGALEDAFSVYTQVFNEPPDIETLVEPMPPADLIPDSLDVAIDIALTENPNVLNSDRRVAASRERRRGAKFDLFPSLDIVGSMNFEKDNGGTQGIRRDMAVLFQANWDIFSGFTTRANVAQAAFDYSARLDDYEFAVRKTIESARLAWQDLKTSRARLVLLENAVNIASEVFESRKKLRSAGKETVINVLDAESEIANARINFASASFDERESIYRLLLSMGRLSLTEIDDAAQGAGDTFPQ